MTHESRQAVLISGWALAVLVLLKLAPPIAQNQDYHLFADQRTIFGIPNFWNVISNLPFALVGVLGLSRTTGTASRIFFGGVLLTCFGSAWYHLAPDDARLVWDRLPMTMGFMSMAAIVFGRRFGGEWIDRLVLPLAVIGAGTVAWWRINGNLTPYVLVQFGCMLVLLVGVIFDKGLRALWPALGLYILAKVAESCDRAIYAMAPISGHTFKHLLASLATFYILRWWKPEEVRGQV